MSSAIGLRPNHAHRRGTALLLAVAVGLALADSSVVVLAVPDLLAELDEPLTDVAQVVTSYNLSLALGAVAAVPLLRTGRTVALTQAGLVLFTLAGIACAAAPGLTALVVARAAQGAGAALLLAGALPVLAALLADAGRNAWTTAGTAGAAVGPALGGALTQAYDWRAVFIVQAPVGAAACLALLRPLPERPLAPDGLAGDGAATRPPLARGAAHAALLLVSGGLAGALFLVVVLLVNGWGLAPLAAAGVASAVPAAAAAAGRVGQRLRPAPAVAAGASLLATGLFGLALLPTSSLLLVAAWLAACGAGLGLSVPPLVDCTVQGRSPEELGRAGSWSVASRHVGLSLALLVVPAVLADDLASSVDRAVASGTHQVLQAQVPLGTKIALAQGLVESVASAPSGEPPDLRPVFAAAARDDPSAADRLPRLEADLEETVRAGAVRGFRGALLITAMLAAAAALPALLLGRATRRATGRPLAARAAPAVAPLAAAALLAAQIAVGGTSYGPAPVPDPCAAPTRYPGKSLDARLQRVLLRALDDAACALGTTRSLVLQGVVATPGARRLPYTDDQLDGTVRTALLTALELEEDEGLNPFVALALRQVVRQVNLREVLKQFLDR